MKWSFISVFRNPYWVKTSGIKGLQGERNMCHTSPPIYRSPYNFYTIALKTENRFWAILGNVGHAQQIQGGVFSKCRIKRIIVFVLMYMRKFHSKRIVRETANWFYCCCCCCCRCCCCCHWWFCCCCFFCYDCVQIISILSFLAVQIPYFSFESSFYVS